MTWGTRWHSWLRHCAYKTEGRGFDSGWRNWLNWLNPSGSIMASNRNEYQVYLGVKGSPCLGLTTWPPSCANCLEILEASTYWSRKGLSSPVKGQLFFLRYNASFNKLKLTFYSSKAHINLLHELMSYMSTENCHRDFKISVMDVRNVKPCVLVTRTSSTSHRGRPRKLDHFFKLDHCSRSWQIVMVCTPATKSRSLSFWVKEEV
jgi:hypothetical protein